MLYILHMGNHPELSYSGGQTPIVHLQADLHEVVEWANKKRRRWAFSDVNAGARYASFCNDLKKLTKINWDAVKATDFRDAEIKDGKQAEFLLHRSFQWRLVEKIGVINTKVAVQVGDVVKKAKHQPPVEVKSDWYF